MVQTQPLADHDAELQYNALWHDSTRSRYLPWLVVWVVPFATDLEANPKLKLSLDKLSDLGWVVPLDSDMRIWQMNRDLRQERVTRDIIELLDSYDFLGDSQETGIRIDSYFEISEMIKLDLKLSDLEMELAEPAIRQWQSANSNQADRGK